MVADDRLVRLLWLSIAAAVATIALKTGAWALTGSVGLLSDAAESVVNLVAAGVAMGVLRWARKPADEEHAFGHAKAEYFSAGVEGAMIFIAAVGIAVVAVARLIDPQPLDDVGLGVAVAAGASAINFAVGLALVRAGRAHRSITAEANGRHLLTDVITSAGVVAGVVAVSITGWERLDPLIALAVAANIIVAGATLLRRSVGGLMDRAIDAAALAHLEEVLDRFRADGVEFHAVRTRESGHRAFVSAHVLVPGGWTVQDGHDLVERVESEVRAVIPGAVVFTHLEPLEDPLSFADTRLDRDDAH